jgi:hypothetical protein
LRCVVSDGSGAPCRHCLRNAGAGKAMLLGSYDLPAPLGIYCTPSPIFLHADPFPRGSRTKRTRLPESLSKRSGITARY